MLSVIRQTGEETKERQGHTPARDKASPPGKGAIVTEEREKRGGGVSFYVKLSTRG